MLTCLGDALPAPNQGEISAWLRQRRQGATLRLDVTKAGGQETHIELDGIRDSAQVIGQVLEFLDENKHKPAR